MKKRFKKFTTTNFYGVTPRDVEGLRSEVRQGKREGKNYSYVVFLGGQTIKWKIMPAVNPAGTLHGLTLLHRNKYGRKGFHKQTKAWGNPSGLRELITAIERHELWGASR